MPTYTVSNITYPLDHGSTVLVNAIGPSLFGGNFLIHQIPSSGQMGTYVSTLNGVGLHNLRYPGGTVTEDRFDMQNPNATTSSRSEERRVGKECA